MKLPVVLIPAAGASRRMEGCDKLMEKIDGLPLILRQVRMAAATGLPVLVTLPAENSARHEALQDEPVEMASLPDCTEGLASSIRAGAAWAAAQQAPALMVVLADLPELTTEDLTAMQRARCSAPDAIWRATDTDGQPGHPVIFPARCFAALGALTGDSGGGALLRNENLRTHPLPGSRATTDLDTPEDWAKWRARTGR